MDNGMSLHDFMDEWKSDSPYMKVKTSGSTGRPKEMLVEKRRMKASARITCDFLGLTSRDTALLCMPLDFIAGKMMAVRSMERGMRLISVEPSSHPLRDLDEVPSFAAMVPMQVCCSLAEPVERVRLMEIKNLIIGGGAVDKDLADELRMFPNAVWSTYGMTETLSHIALRRLSGDKASDFYTPFNGVELSAAGDGCLVISAPAVCKDTLKTNDIVEFASDGRRFRILGRKDNVVDSGGVKIHIEDVEAGLSGRIDVDFAVSKLPDRLFGEIVVLAVAKPELCAGAADKAELPVGSFAAAFGNLPKYWRPKRVFAVRQIPHTQTGKIARAEMAKLLGGK